MSVLAFLWALRSRPPARRSTPGRGASLAPTLTVLLAPLLVAPLLTAPRVVADPTPAPEIAAHRDRVFEDPSLQTDLPGWEALEGIRSSKSRRSPPRRGWWLPDPPMSAALASAGQLLRWMLLTAGAVALVIGLLWLIRELVSHRPLATSRQVTAGDEPAEPDEKARSPVEGDLETLVGLGEYGAAIHLLLLKTLDRLSGRGRRIPAGRTSREVLSASGNLAPPAHGALRELVVAVERYLFGGREPRRDDFERCHRAFSVVDETLPETVADPAAKGTT